MHTQDSEFDIKDGDVTTAIDTLEDETGELAELNDEPHVKQEEVEGFIAAIIRIVAAIFKH